MKLALVATLTLAPLYLVGCRKSDDNEQPPPMAPPSSPTALTYTTTSAPYVIGEPIVPNEPTVDGSALGFSVAPALPAGLAIQGTSGMISGTPTALTAAADYVVTAANSVGSTTTTVTIQVVSSMPDGLAYGDATPVYVVGRKAPANLPSFTGIVESFSVAPPLPDGLQLDETTGVLRGTPAVAAVTTAHTVTATGPTGAATAGILLTVTPHELSLDDHQGGAAPEVILLEAAWGRLADVYDRDPATGARTLHRRQMVVGEDIDADAGPYAVTTNPITQVTSVTILHEYGTPEYAEAFDALDANLVPILSAGVGGGSGDTVPPSRVPRNAAVLLHFDDLLDASTITAESLRLFTGYPPETPFELRVLADRNHGQLADTDADGVPEFHPTRVILDTTVSEVEAAEHPRPLGVNLVGLPEAQSAGEANALLRIPTAEEDGLAAGTVLRNLRGNPLAVTGNGSVDPETGDVLRAFRSGGGPGTTGDPSYGFLADVDPPRVIGAQTVDVTIVAAPNPFEFTVDLAFHQAACAQAPVVGDVLQRAPLFLEVTQPGPAPVGGVVSGVQVTVVSGDPAQFAPGVGGFFSVWAPVADAGQEDCFVGFLPVASTFPPQDVSTAAQVVVRFTEPMNLATITPFGELTITRTATPGNPFDYVVGDVVGSLSPEVFWVPTLPFAHEPGVSESYFLNMEDGGPEDLSGNALVDALPQVRFDLDPGQPRESNDGFALSFESTDEDGNGFPELRGQFLYDLTGGRILSRPVVHSSLVADRTQPVPGSMVPFTPGVQPPLTPLGSKLQSLWRYYDVGQSLLDETGHNLDVEGLAWSPVGGSVISETYAEFEIRLSHGGFLPDEILSPSTLFPVYPDSGVTPTYADNLLDPAADPQSVVHPRERGYAVNPGDLFSTPQGTPMMPYPLNRGVPVGDRRYYTWRDTAIQSLGGPNGTGADTSILSSVLNDPAVQPGVPYAAGAVPTIGLPLLMEYRCYPDSVPMGLNAFDVSIAVNSSARPNFRAYSAGGVNVSGNVVTVDPDNTPVATGGFNPSSNPPGLALPPTDNVFYVGQMDVVIRVSRVHTIWFDTQTTQPAFIDPVTTPRPQDLPDGTAVTVAWRGATDVMGPPAEDAQVLDPYGDPWSGSGSVVHTGGDPSWRDDVGAVDGSRWIQARLTFVGNPETSLSPWLTGFGLAWQRP